MNWDTGKKIRMRRLIDEETGLILAVPMDHGYTLGPIKGLKNINQTVKSVFAGGASSIIVQKGNVRNLTDAIPSNGGLMVHLSGSTSLSPLANVKVMSGSVFDALRLGADAVSCHVNVGPDGDTSMLEDLNHITEEADSYGLPTLAMMYARDNNGNDNKDPEVLAHVARIAQETGADIVKINSPVNPTDFEDIVQGIDIPIVIAGGDKTDNFSDFVAYIKKIILAGAFGVSIGRNVFQADDPQLAMHKMKDAIKESVKEVGKIEILS